MKGCFKIVVVVALFGLVAFIFTMSKVWQFASESFTVGFLQSFGFKGGDDLSDGSGFALGDDFGVLRIEAGEVRSGFAGFGGFFALFAVGELLQGGGAAVEHPCIDVVFDGPFAEGEWADEDEMPVCVGWLHAVAVDF